MADLCAGGTGNESSSSSSTDADELEAFVLRAESCGGFYMILPGFSRMLLPL